MKITPLKMWVQNVLPVVYDDSLSYYEMVGKINEKTNEIIKQVNENTDGIEALNYVIQQLGDIDELKALLEQVEVIVNDLYTSDTPIMDSPNGSAGVAEHAARSDHSHPSDSSKADTGLGIIDALAGQYVRIKTVDENGVPTEYENYMPHEIPSGGTTGQALRKESNGNYIVEWDDVHEVPNGGTTGQALKKNSNTDYDASWSDTHEIPNGGNDGNILVKDGAAPFEAMWTDTPQQMGSLATINKTQWAEPTNGYKQGEYFVHNGQLYKATTDISQWQTLIPGTNTTVPSGGGLNDVQSSLLNTAKGRADVLYDLGSGTPFTSGSLTIPNISKYSILAIALSNGATLIATEQNNAIVSGGVVAMFGSENLLTFGINYALDLSTDTISITSDRRGYSDGITSNYNGNTVGLKTVTGIIIR